ncbi:N-acetylglucosamine-6-phosphate deacetylase isoform X2 [Loxodonta africana]|uniref:N-acetylglucosamine-6-phosphate deacetylase isoform X2 n=1 Tax=Loxodonta africana TaxID=9785 RepID=UPI0030CBE392
MGPCCSRGSGGARLHRVRRRWGHRGGISPAQSAALGHVDGWVTWPRRSRGALPQSAEGYVAPPALGLPGRGIWTRRSCRRLGSRCAAGRARRGPRSSSSPTADSCEAGRCSGRTCGFVRAAFWIRRSCSLTSGAWPTSRRTAEAAYWRQASSTCRSTADLALTSLRPPRTWVQGSPWWPGKYCHTESRPSVPRWSPPRPRFIISDLMLKHIPSLIRKNSNPLALPVFHPKPKKPNPLLWSPGGVVVKTSAVIQKVNSSNPLAASSKHCGVLPQIPVKRGGPHGAGVIGVHLEGPFISRQKRGAHPEAYVRSFEANAFHDVLATYGSLDNVCILTLAPELGRSHEVIQELTARGIRVSLGHSVADLRTAEDAMQSGATFITHLFNAMLPFHHRDPGIVGLLTSDQVPPGRHIFYGMIADGIHTNPAALRIAHRAHPQGNGRHTLGQQVVEVDGLSAYVAGTKTLCGSIAPMDVCVRHFLQTTGCSVESALESASLHPAQLLGLEKHKGTLDFGADADSPVQPPTLVWLPAWSTSLGLSVPTSWRWGWGCDMAPRPHCCLPPDFVVLDDALHVQATYISGELVWQAEMARQ